MPCLNFSAAGLYNTGAPADKRRDEKKYVMKSMKPQVRAKHINPDTHKKRPDVRDNLDHREGEEQEDKGDSTTHNKKEHRTPPKKQE